MRTNEEFIAEARRRAIIILEKRRKKRNRIFAACAVTACAALSVGLAAIFSRVELTPVTDVNNPAVATVMADSAIGGYVLLGVICFVLGTAVTLLCVRRAGKKDGFLELLLQDQKKTEASDGDDIGKA